MSPLIFICAFLSFLIAVLLTPWLIHYLKRIGLLVRDANKKDQPLVPLSGGPAVFSGFFVGIMFFIFYRTFFSKGESVLFLDGQSLVLLFAGITTILIVTFIGFLDDLVIKPSKESSHGLRQWQKPLLTLAASVPLMVLNAGTDVMALPVLGKVQFGILYPLLLVPIGIVGASNMVNMLAGFNGMETGIGMITVGMLGLYAFVHERWVAALIAAIMVPALLAFYIYNRYPAKILAGDSLTYLIGATIGVVAILGNLEKAALIISIPFFIEFVLKARKKFHVDSYGYWKDGKVQSKYDKIYSIPHLFTIHGKYTERQISCLVMGIFLLFSLLIWVI
jgi:UDP-N-acetylglucosamine--dolichyl-phosphate N-acetylglucosaminephosphotransferase